MNDFLNTVLPSKILDPVQLTLIIQENRTSSDKSSRVQSCIESIEPSTSSKHIFE